MHPAVAPADVAAPGSNVHVRSILRIARHHPGLVVGSIVILGFLAAGLFAHLPYDPTTPDPAHTLLSPRADHIMGTDQNGFDVFSRVVASSRLDVPLALAGAFLAAIIGIPLGLFASTRTRASNAIVRALDIFQAFPLIILAVVVVALSGNDLKFVVVAIMLVNVPQFIRLVRSEALVVREQRYVEAAEATGASRLRVTFRHVLPNVTGTIFAQLSLSVGNGVIALAALSFIGVGVQPPNPSWGAMIRDGSQYVATGQWWLALFPGLAILVFVVSFNAIADSIEDALRPH